MKLIFGSKVGIYMMSISDKQCRFSKLVTKRLQSEEVRIDHKPDKSGKSSLFSYIDLSFEGNFQNNTTLTGDRN